MGDSLLALVKNLERRIEKLEKDNVELKKWAYKEKKKIDIIAWLNEHYLPLKDFSQWIQELTVTQKHLQFVFDHRIEKGAYYIMEHHLPLEERRHFPIIAFKHQRKSTFYVYEKDSWRKIKKGEFDTILEHINIKLVKAFNEWEKKHSEMSEEENRETWRKNLSRILLLPEKKYGIIERLEKRIHTYLALNIKNIIEYEFIF